MTLTCIGQASAYDFKAGEFFYRIVEGGVWVAGHSSGTGKLNIPSIAFYNGTKYNVTGVDDNAFNGSSMMTSITIADGVQTIGASAFCNCTALKTINLPASVKSIGDDAFANCTALTTASVNGDIGDRAFYGCGALTTVTLNSTVTSIGNDAFYRCSGLTSITIPNSVTSIGYSAFSCCSSLTSVTIPNSVTSIDDYAFQGCTSLPVINNIRYADCYAVEATDKSLASYTFKEGTRFIGEQAFSGCSDLTSITIPNSVTSIGFATFSGCSSLTSITIPNSVTSIGRTAFCNCSSLTSITIPNSVTSIGDDAFFGCTSLPVINNIRYADCYVVEATDKSLASYTFKEGTRFIGMQAFSGCSELTSITIPNSVTSIGTGAFYECTGLTSITIPAKVTSIGDEAFYHCSCLTTVNIGRKMRDLTTRQMQLISALTDIGYSAFQGCSILTSISIPKSVKRIGSDAFYGCTNLTDVTNHAVTPQAISDYTFSTYGTLYVKNGYKETYAQTDVWKNFTIKTIASEIKPFVLNDSEAYAPMAPGELECDGVNYTRNFSHTNWQALYVPFSMDYDEWKDGFDVASPYNFIDYDDDEDGVFEKTIFVVRKITSGSLKPNHPYLIRAKEVGEKTLNLKATVLAPAEANSIDCSSTELKFTFTGTYEGVSGSVMRNGGFYAMSGGKLLLPEEDEDVSLASQRWYMSIESRDGSSAAVKAQAIQILTDGEDTTEIERVTAICQAKNQTTFDLTGRAVKAGTKGINIINGKKIIR